MTVLTACAEAAVELKQPVPTSLFTSSGTFEAELRLQANRTAVAIAQMYDWQRLLTLATLSGDGTAETFTVPVDYDRMPKKGKLHSSSWQTATFRKATDLDEWLYLKDTDFSATPGNWIIIGNDFNIFPVMAVGETARFYYISNKIVSDAQATPAYKTTFTADTDTFVLSERLLALGIVWRWKAQNSKDYAEAMANFNIALQEEIGKDRGSNIITVGRQRWPGSVRVAYPGVLGP